ncbi:hypothetical protein OKW43_006755 [Paraburkholderia sp. WC7.3g]|uniref:hypothetical protein n=1 Tax=Paraburkholderia sp. WC7.3g TaxID=2991070 RepID=UPI003D2550F7
MTTPTVKATVFAVADEPYCVWEHPFDTHNLDFLRGADAEYFGAVGRMAGTEFQKTKEDEHRGATVARLALHQGVETLFSLLAAMLQAPKSVYAWLVSRIGVIEPVMIGIMRPPEVAPKRDFEGTQECGFLPDFATVFSLFSGIGLGLRKLSPSITTR